MLCAVLVSNMEGKYAGRVHIISVIRDIGFDVYFNLSFFEILKNCNL